VKKKAVLLMVTSPTRDEAENLGEALLAEGLAIRGSVIPVIHSFWLEAGRLERSHEAMLLVTTNAATSEAATAYIRDHDSFQASQIVSIAIAE
jgi:uncharacterized protein involved in tolerance to divalent cations